MLTLLGPFLRKCYCFSGCTNIRVAFFFNPGMDQLSHLDSKKSASGSHRSDIWVRNKQYPEYFGANGLSFFSSGHPITTRCWSSRAWCWTDEAMMGRSRGSLISRQSISGELTPLIFFTWFFSEMRGRPDEEEESEKRPRRKISAWWDPLQISFQRKLTLVLLLISNKPAERKWTIVGEYQISSELNFMRRGWKWVKKEINVLQREKMSHQRATCFPWIKIVSLMKLSGRTRIRTLKI